MDPVSSLSFLARRFKPILVKRPGLALALWGPAGIGKSYAIRQLLPTLSCRYISIHATTPLATLIQQLPEATQLPLWVQHNLKRLKNGEALENSLDTLAALLAALAPFVLHLEDIHDATQERQAFIQDLARLLKRLKGVALIVTTHTQPPEPFEAIRLEPLSSEKSESLLEQHFAAPLPKHALDWIYSKAAGNPLYTLEYARYLSRQGFLWNDGQRWHWRQPEKAPMPVTVEALLELSLAGLPDKQVQDTLNVKAYLPIDAEDEVWATVARLSKSALEHAKILLRKQGIFHHDNFVHPLYRDVLLKNLDLSQRESLARRTLEALQHQPLEATDFIADANLPAEEALDFYQKAVKQIIMHQPLKAGYLLAQAIPYAHGAQKSQLALKAAQLLKNRDNPQALRLAQLACEINASDDVLYCLADLLANQHRLSEAETILSQISDTSKQDITWPLRLAGIYASALELDKLLTLVHEQPSILGHDAYLDYLVCYAYHYTGDTPKAEALAQQALQNPALKDYERARFLGIFETLAIGNKDYARALSFSDERQALFRNSQQIYSLASTLEKRAELLEHLGHYTEQLKYLQEAYTLFSQVGDSRRITSTQADLAYALIQRGDYEQAQILLLEARETLQRLEVSDSHLLVESFLILLYYEWQPALVSSLVSHHIKSLMRIEGKWLMPIMKAGVYWMASLATSWLGDNAYALQLSEEGIRTARELNYPNILAANLYARGLALERSGDIPAAMDSLEEAINVFLQAGFEERAQRVALEKDRLAQNSGNAKARLDWFKERGLLNGVNIARRYFPELKEKQVTKTPERVLRLEVLGSMQACSAHLIPIRGRKRQELLGILFEAQLSGQSEISRSSLLEALYPHEDEIRASSSLKTLVHGLREVLGEAVIITSARGYALGSSHSDAEQFLKTGDTNLWRGPYLEGLEHPGSTVSEALYRFLFEQLKTLLNDNPQEAARVGHILTSAEPYNTNYLKIYLKALELTTSRRNLTRHYEKARISMLEVDERLPASWEMFLDNAKTP